MITRKLYKRGSSYETTIPLPILIELEESKEYNVIFKYDKKEKQWYIEFEQV